MSRDIQRLLERAAGAPARLDDPQRLWQKGRRRRLRDLSAMASASSLLIAGLLAYGLPFTTDGGSPRGERGAAERGPATTKVCDVDEFGCVRIAEGEPIT